MDSDNKVKTVSTSFSLESIGVITWIVFLVLKLCNMNNPDFEWLTWFWVWFPLWAPIALSLVLVLIAFMIATVIFLVQNRDA